MACERVRVDDHEIAGAGVRARSLGPLLLWAGLVLAGCSAVPVPDWAVWPWRPEERVRYELPRDRAAKARQLADSARDQGEGQEEQVATQLATWIDGETDPVVRMAIFESLADLRGPAAASAVRAGLEDQDPRVRIASCEALGKRGEVENVAALAEVIHKDEQIDVRLAAVRGLAHYKQPQAVSAMVYALEDSDPALQYRAVEALKQMTGVDLGNDVNRWIQFARGETPSSAPMPSLAERIRGLWFY